MATLDTRIPLMVQNPNLLNALAQGTQMAGQAANMIQAGDQRRLYQQHGPGIMAGDPAAMNALARMNPQAAFNMNQGRAEGRRADRRLAISEEQLKMAREAAAEAVRNEKNKQQAAIEVKQAEEAFKRMVFAYESGDVRAASQMARELQWEGPIDENAIRLIGASVGGAAEEVAKLYEAPENKPLSPEGKLYADLQAGRITQDQFDAALEKTPPFQFMFANEGTASPSTEEAPDIGNVAGAYGLSDSVLNTLNSWSDSLFGTEFRPEEAQADTVIRDVNDRAMLVGAANFPGRPSNLTRERLERTLPQPGAKGEANALRKAEGTRDFFIEGVTAAKEALKNPDLSPNMQAELYRYISSAEPMIAFYGKVAEELKKANSPSGEGSTSSGVKWKIVE